MKATYVPSKADSLTKRFDLILTSLGNGNCDASSDHITVKMDLRANGDFEASNACSGQKTQFKDSLSTDKDVITSWSWDFGDGGTANVHNPVHLYSTDGFFNTKLVINTKTGCSDTINKQVIIYKNPIVNFDYYADKLAMGVPINFSDISVGANLVFWDFGDGTKIENNENPEHIYEKSGNYRVELKVVSEYGCTDSLFKFLEIEKNESVFPPAIPTGFSPNNDDVNDVLYVRGGPFQSIEFSVYNEWGELIFSTTDPASGWDGTKKGKRLPQGDYIYTVKAITIDGRSFVRSGEVSLIR